MIPGEIARKYIEAPDGLIISKKMSDMAEDIDALIMTVHYNACCSMIENCRKEWKMTGGFSYPLHPPIDMDKKI